MRVLEEPTAEPCNLTSAAMWRYRNQAGTWDVSTSSSIVAGQLKRPAADTPSLYRNSFARVSYTLILYSVLFLPLRRKLSLL
jgi:hypothetical protein